MGQKQSKMVKNGKNGQKQSETVRNNQKQKKIVKNGESCQKQSKTLKTLKNYQIGQKL